MIWYVYKFTPYFSGMGCCRSQGRQNRFAPNKSHALDPTTHTPESSSDPHQTQVQPTAHSQYETQAAPTHTTYSPSYYEALSLH